METHSHPLIKADFAVDKTIHRNSVTNRTEPKTLNQSMESLKLSKSGSGLNIHSKKSEAHLSKAAISIMPLEEEETGSTGSPVLKHSSSNFNQNQNGVKQRIFSYFGKKSVKGGVGVGVQSIQDLSMHKRAESKQPKPQTRTLSESKKQTNASAFEIRESPTNNQPKGLSDYHIIRRVGKGGFATVFLIRLKASNGRYFALKAIKKQEVLRLKQEKQIMNEKYILSELTHPLLVDLYHTFQSPSNLFLVLEYVAGGDLFTLLRKSKMFPEVQAKFYVCEVITVLEYLHSVKVVYRDLKPENILLDSTGHIKLADFGFAKRLTTTTSSFCGTPDYIAYEIVVNRPYTFTVDWWSLGVLIFELVSGKTPFRADDSEGIYQNVQKGNIQYLPVITGAIKEVVAGLLELDPKKRLGHKGALQIKEAKWFQGIPWDKVGHLGIKPPVVPAFISAESLEQEKVTKGIQSDYSDILGDSPSAMTFKDGEGPFKGF